MIMSVEIPKHNPEKKEKLDDNARKFITNALSPELLGARLHLLLPLIG